MPKLHLGNWWVTDRVRMVGEKDYLFKGQE